MLWPSDKYDIAFSKIVEDALTEGTTILMLVAPDPDALATHLILKQLLKTEAVSFTVHPVGGYDDLLTVHEKNIQGNMELRSVILVGCGAMLNLPEAFPLMDEVTCYVIDSHRPVDIQNVHSDSQYVVFSDVLLDQEDIPSDDEDIDDLQAVSDHDEHDGNPDHDAEEDNEEFEDEFEDEDEMMPNDSKVSGSSSSSNAPSPGSAASNSALQQQEASPARKRKRETRGKKESDKDDENEDEDDENEDEDSSGGGGGGGGGGSNATTRKEKQRERQRRVRDYYSGTKTGTPASYVAYDLANQLGRGSNDLLWYAIVGVTDHYEQGRLDQDIYSGLHMSLRDWVNNLNADGVTGSKTTAAVDDEDTRVRVPDEGRIHVMEEEYRIMLYRHWSVYEALYHGQYVSTQLLTWTEKGRKRLDTFLAKMGISIKECSQSYNYMTTSGKAKLRAKVGQFKNEHGLDNLLYRSFTRVHNYTNVTSAADTAHAVLAMLECGKMGGMNRVHVPGTSNGGGGSGGSSSSSGSNSSNNQGNGAMNADNDEEAKRNASEFAERLGANFHDAQRVFQLTSSNNSSDHSFLKGVRLAKDVQMAVIRQGVAVIQQRLLRNAGKFRYAYLSTMSDGDLNFFKRPPLLSKLAHWLIKALPHTKKRVASNNLPIVLCVLDEERQVYICVGTPGPNEIKNRFGQAFRKAADLIEVRYKHDSFTSSVIEIEKEHVMNFTDQLYLTLENMDRRRLPQRNVRQRTSFEDTAGQDGSEDAGMDNVGHGVLDESLQAIE